MAIIQPTISWETIVSESTTYTGDYNYTCKLNKTNPNDSGYGDLQVGYYIVDFVGHIFEITGINYDGDSEAVIVHDLLERDEENGPYGLREAYVYGSLYQAATIAQAKLNRLDKSAEDFVRSLGVSPTYVDAVQFNTTYVPDAGDLQEGFVHWNQYDNTMNLHTGYGSVLQVGQEIHIKVYNNSGGTISDGVAVYPTGAFNDYPTIGLARTNTHETVAVDYGMTTTSMDDGEYGFVTWFGKVRGIDTSMWDVGDRLWISPDNPGELVNVQPTFPDYAIQIGIVFIKNVGDGQIFVTSRDTVKDTILNFWNGVFRESFDFRISSNGTTIIGSLKPNNGHDDMTMMFSDGFTLLDTNPALTIELTPGSATIPQSNYIYIPQSTKVLTVSTSDWPSTVEHIKVALVELSTAVITQEGGALRNQNWNDHVQSTTSGQGHLSHIGEKIRQFEAQWYSGVEGSATDNAGIVYIKNTAGVVYQMHRQNFPLLDMTQYGIDAVSTGSSTFTISGDGDLSSTFIDGRLIQVNDSTGNDGIYTIDSTVWSDPNFVITVEEIIVSDTAPFGTIGDDIHIINHDTVPYTILTDLADLTLDASGNALNNTSFSIVVWGVQNKTGEESHLMANLPSDTYSKNFPQQAIDDAFNYSIYSIPKKFQGVGFLIARFTFVNSGGTWTLEDTEDLRGKIPNSTAGGGAGGTGVTSLLGLIDTPSAYTGQAYKLLQVNVGETAEEFVSDVRLDSIDEWTANNGILLSNTLTVDQTNSNVGIGTTNPSDYYSASRLVVAGTSETAITIASSTTGTGYLLFADGTTTSEQYMGQIRYLHTSNRMEFVTNGGSANMIIDSSGNVAINSNLSVTGTITGSSIIKSGGTSSQFLMADGSISTGLLTTKGDLQVFTTVGTRLPIGTNDYVLTADSTEASGMKWAATSGGSVSFGSQYEIPYTNSTTDDFDYDPNLAWDGTRLTLKSPTGASIYIGTSVAPSVLTTAYSNVIIGNSAASSLTGGDYNILLGRNTGDSLTSAGSNVMIGDNVGVVTTLSNNVMIGYYAGKYETGASKLFIDTFDRGNEADARTESLIYGVFDGITPSNQLLRINGDLNIKHDLDHDGTYVGFFGVTPVVQQAVEPGPIGDSAPPTYSTATRDYIDGINTAQEAIWNALEALGLIYSPA